MDLEKIERLIRLTKQHGLHEIEVEERGYRIKVTTAGVAPVMARSFEAAPGSDPISAASTTSLKPNQKQILSPFVGTFYEAPSPGTEAFVGVGSRVKRGAVLCIIEAMKLMNEIEADVDGVVAAILVGNEEPVEFHQPLFIIET